MVKVNFDAALDSNNYCVGLGLLARDEQGHFLVACGLNQKIVVDSIMAEALVALHAVLFAKELGFSNVIFEGDALTIAKEVNSMVVCESSYGHFVEDVKHFLSDLPTSSFVHVVRGANWLPMF